MMRRTGTVHSGEEKAREDIISAYKYPVGAQRQQSGTCPWCPVTG